MLNHKQQAKMAVLKHLSKMMDGMMGDKLKAHKGIKPVSAHMEVDMMPKEHAGPSDSVDPLAPPHHESSEMSADHSGDDADMEMLKNHYSSLK